MFAAAMCNKFHLRSRKHRPVNKKRQKIQARSSAEADGLHADRLQVQSTLVNLTLPLNALQFISPIRLHRFAFQLWLVQLSA